MFGKEGGCAVNDEIVSTYIMERAKDVAALYPSSHIGVTVCATISPDPCPSKVLKWYVEAGKRHSKPANSFSDAFRELVQPGIAETKRKKAAELRNQADALEKEAEEMS